MATEPTTDLIFEDPPKGGRGPHPGNPVRLWLDALRDHPGKWTKYPDDMPNRNLAHNIASAKCYGVYRGEFETRSASAGEGRFWIYARYVGGES